MLILLLAFWGCGETVRSEYGSQDVLSRYDRDGGERTGYDAMEKPQSEETAPTQDSGSLNYARCIDFALHNSPKVVSGSVKLQLEDLSIEDSYSQMFPELQVNMTVSKKIYTADPDNTSKADTTARLNFSSGTYDPFGAYFSYEAQKILKRVAVVKHLSAIDSLMHEVAKQYLYMEVMQARIKFLGDIDKILGRVVDYYAALPSNKASKSIELLEAQGRRKSSLLAQEMERVALKNVQVHLKMLIGADLTRNMDFSAEGVSDDLLGEFNPQAVSLEKIKDASRDLFVSRLAKEAAKYKIMLARSEYIPTFSLGLETPDPVASGSNVQKDYYGTLSFQTPILDWGRRSRGVERGRLAQTSSVYDLMATTKKVEAEYFKIRHELELAQATDEYEKSVAELNGLKFKKNEILFESGVISLPKLLLSEVEIINSKIAILDAALVRDLSVLSIKSASGELFESLVGEVNDDIR